MFLCAFQQHLRDIFADTANPMLRTGAPIEMRLNR